MTLFLTDGDVRRLVSMGLIVDAVEAAFIEHATGHAENAPRSRLTVETPGGNPGSFQVMFGSAPGSHAFGVKAYSGGWPAGLSGAVLLFDSDNGLLEAVIAAGEIGRLRTGAVSGVATKHLARDAACTLGIIGAGAQASSQIEAIASVRQLASVRVYCRTESSRRLFARHVRDTYDVECVAAPSAEAAVQDAEIVVTATSSRLPVVLGASFAAGSHINAVGANSPGKRELDTHAVGRASSVVVDVLDQARQEAGDLIAASEEGVFDWARAIELGRVVSGRSPGRGGDDDITLFESQGVAFTDLVVARVLVDAAREQDIGRKIDLRGG